MSRESFKKALSDAKADLGEALRQRDDLDLRIADLRQTISTLSRLSGVGSDGIDPMGLTESVRLVLKTATGALSPVEVQDKLREIGFPLGKYAQPMAMVHTVLNRLVENEEVEDKQTDAGKKVYYWKWLRRRPT